jgi:tetratricopeptide (TPR) repeat protein
MKRMALVMGIAGLAATVRLSGQEKIHQAEALLAQGDARGVITLLQAVTPTDIQYRESLRLLTEAYYAAGRPDSAEIRGRELLAFNERNLDAIVPVVRALTVQKKFADAYSVMRRGQKGNKDKPAYLLTLGNLALAADSVDAAEVAFTKAKNADPGAIDAYIGLGQIYERRGATAIAIFNYEEAVRLDSSRIDLKHTLAQWLAKEQRYNEAAKIYIDVIRSSVDKVQPSLELGSIYYKAKQFDNAASVLANYVKAHPEDTATWKVFVESVGQGRKANDIGLAIADSILLKDPVNPRALKLAGKCGTLVGKATRSAERHQTAIVRYQALAAIQPLDAEDMKYLGKAHFELKADDLAIEHMQKSLSIDSTQADIYMDLGFAYMRKKNWSSAAVMFMKTVDADSGNGGSIVKATALINYALCQEQLGQWNPSRDALVRALAIVPNNILGHINLAITYRQMGADSLNQAKREYETILALIDTNKTRYRNELGDAYKQIAFINLVNKNWPAAADAIAKSLEFRTKDVELVLWHAQTLHALGRKDEARGEYEHVIKIAPKTKEAKDAQQGLDRLDLGF